MTLTDDEYYSTIEQTASQGSVSWRIYDVLLLRCAAKVEAEITYTWNVKHFRAISPKAADRIRTQ